MSVPSPASSPSSPSSPSWSRQPSESLRSLGALGALQSFSFASSARTSPFPPGTEVPATCEVPSFAPVRVRGGRCGLRRLVRHRRRAMAAGLAVTAAALVAAGPRVASDPSRGGPARGHPVRADSGRTVTVPVRLADAATVRLLRPGDRVDVIAAEDPAVGGRARVVARGARVARVPDPVTDGAAAGGSESGGGADSGALVALSVPRSAAARLAGAGATARLAVSLW
ncbi:RcpC/CpaB family pilus assembly protein [Streptomyces sp. MK7]|uniref:RcpC/CpaB family pilus assembly protein n=1 Tax=Streptomyces sp. MK7 TaxID=3067635 RepID=UPI0029310D72|nr:RcpC/CpaB family pilus assembly protein [Streptomyces sp. MK7]